ncbi:mCG145603, partial [Mus musculus]
SRAPNDYLTCKQATIETQDEVRNGHATTTAHRNGQSTTAHRVGHATTTAHRNGHATTAHRNGHATTTAHRNGHATTKPLHLADL